MRAFAVHVNEVVGVAGFAVAGMRVDVLVSGVPRQRPRKAPIGPVTRTLLQNIEVLSAGQNFQKDAEGKPVLVQVVNLLVTPEQAEVLNLATEQSIQLVLRNPSDKEIVKTPGASTSNLFAGGTVAIRHRLAASRTARRCGIGALCGTRAPGAERSLSKSFSGDKRVESIRSGRRRAHRGQAVKIRVIDALCWRA